MAAAIKKYMVNLFQHNTLPLSFSQKNAPLHEKEISTKNKVNYTNDKVSCF